MPDVVDPAIPKSETLAEKAQLEEFKMLRGEVELRGTEQRAMERYVILADAAIYSVLVFPKADQVVADQLLQRFVWWLPPIIGFLALIRWHESVKMIETLAEFLRRRERELFGAAGSWEWFLFLEKRQQGQVGLFSSWYIVYWSTVIGGTAALASHKTLETMLATHPKTRVEIAIAIGLILSAVIHCALRPRPSRRDDAEHQARRRFGCLRNIRWRPQGGRSNRRPF